MNPDPAAAFHGTHGAYNPTTDFSAVSRPHPGHQTHNMASVSAPTNPFEGLMASGVGVGGHTASGLHSGLAGTVTATANPAAYSHQAAPSASAALAVPAWATGMSTQGMYAAAAAAAAAAGLPPSTTATTPAQVEPPGPRPTYVNAKQYKRILKRREARARLEEYYRQKRAAAEAAGQRKPYLHESRHRHAMKRPRGPGGRFLTKAELAEYYKKHPEQDPNNVSTSSLSNPTESGEHDTEQLAQEGEEEAAKRQRRDLDVLIG